MKKTILATFLAGIFAAAHAEEVKEGTVLSKANLAELENKTFEGTPIKDLLAFGQRYMIENHGWEMKLVHSKPIEYNPNLVEVTKKFAGEVQIDPKTKLLKNFKAGMPFPKIEPSDPLGGYKVAYNYMRGPWSSDTQDLNPMYILSIDGKGGLQRQMGMRFARLMMVGRVTEPYILGDGKVAKYETGVFSFPEDLKGIGTVTVQYMDGRLPDVYAYLKMVRRVRRLSSSAWADPISATDLLTDEQFGMNVDPVWYKDWKLKEKRKIFGVIHGLSDGLHKDESDSQKRYPTVHFNQAPHWNFDNNWEPRDVWVVEATPPDTHMVSKKVQYYDADPLAPALYWQDFYDRRGKFWRIENCNWQVKKGMDGNPAIYIEVVLVADIQRLHGTMLYNSPDYKYNIPNPNVNDFTPDALTRLAQ
jgi:hypothetical protein